jgi:hypothetical protein
VGVGLFAFVLDGVFLGSLIAALVWAAVCFCRCVCMPLCQKCCRRSVSAAAAMLLLTSAGVAAAQPQQVEPRPPLIDPRPDWTVIVPYDPAADPFAAEKVFLNQAQFVELWNRARPDQPLVRPADRPALLAGASFVAELDRPEGSDPAIQVTARFVLHLLRDGTHALPLPLRQVALESARLDGRPAALTAATNKREPAYRVNVSGAGIHLLDVTFRLPVELAGEAGQFTLPLTAPVPGTLTFRLPDDEVKVRVNGTTTAYRRIASDAGESVVVPLGETAPVSVSWNPPSMGAGVDRVIQVETVSKVIASDAGLSLVAGFEYRIRQGSVEELLYQLPEGWNLQTISGPDVGGWSVEGNEEQRLIRVFLRRAIEETTQVAFELFRAARIDGDPLQAEFPRLIPLEVTREIGHLGLFATSHLSIRAPAPDHAARIENNLFPGGIQHAASGTALQLAYRFSRSDYALLFTVERKAPEAKATSNHGLIVEETRGQLASKFVVNLGDTPRSRLSFRLPEMYVILDVQASALDDWYQAESADGERLLILDFPAPISGSVQIALGGYLRKEPMDEIIEVFVPSLLEMTEDKTTLAVWTSGNYRLSTDELDGWKALNVDQVPAEVRKLQDRPVDLAYEATRADERYLSVLITRLRPVISADTVTILNLTDTAIVFQLAVKWAISRATTDRFVFTTPDSFAGKLNFSGAPNLRNYSSELLDDGRVRWTVFLTQPQGESYFLSPLVILPPPENGDLAIPRLQVEAYQTDDDGNEALVPVPQQRHYAVLVNQSNARLSVNDAALLEPISLADLPLNTDRTLVQQATDIFRLRPERDLPSWTLRTFEQKRGAAAVVNFAQLTSVVEDDGGWRMHASYLIRNRGRQFLGLKLPAGARLLSAAVRDEPVRPVKTTLGGEDDPLEVTLLPLPKGGEADVSFFAEIVLAGQLPQGNLTRELSVFRHHFDLPAPRVVSMKESPTLGIPVSRTSWNVYLPEHLDAEEVDDIDRTNLSPRPPEEAELDLRIVQLKETNSVLATLTETENQNLAVQHNAALNARILEREIRERLSYGNLDYKSNPRFRELQAEQRKLSENLEGQEEIWERQKLARETGDIEYFNRNYSTLDSRSQLGLTIQGNALLYGSNMPAQSLPDSTINGVTAGKQFNFAISPSSKPDVSSAAKSAAPATKSGLEKRRITNQADDDFLRREHSARAEKEERAVPPQRLSAPIFDEGRDGILEGLNRPADSPFDYGSAGGYPGVGGMGGMGGGGMGGMGGGGFRMNEPPSGRRREERFEDSGPGMGRMPLLQSRSGAMGEAVDALDDSESMRLLSLEVRQQQQVWPSTRGISLTFEIPTAGRLHSFSKAGGDPRLALEVRPSDDWTVGIRLVWFAIWGGLAWLAVRLVRGGRQLSGEQWALAAFALGVMLALLIPAIGPLPGLSLATAAGIAWLVCRVQHQPPAPAPPPETG